MEQRKGERKGMMARHTESCPYVPQLETNQIKDVTVSSGSAFGEIDKQGQCSTLIST